MTTKVTRSRSANQELNRLRREDRAAHDWYRFVLSFPPQLVREYLDKLGATTRDTVLDPFSGTGTTLVECKKLQIPSVGLERNPLAHFASCVKTDWSIDPDGLLRSAEAVADRANALLASDGIEDNPLFVSTPDDDTALRTLPEKRQKLLLKNSLSPLPLHKAVVLAETIERLNGSPYRAHQMLAFAKSVVSVSSNLRFGPEIGVGRIKDDAPVVAPWQSEVKTIARDLRELQSMAAVPSAVHFADAREPSKALEPESVDVVITSPPYPNEKDYSRTTRLESVLLGFVTDKKQLQTFKKGLLRSNTRGVYKADDDDAWVEGFPEVKRIADEIERRRIAMRKTSGFERMYHRVAKLYFGGMMRHFADLRSVLRPGARLAYVVGDQASFLQVMIRTGQILADIARTLGYEVVGIDLFRTRMATATREQLREEVILLRWPG